MAISVVLSLVIIISATYIADFYDEPRVGDILLYLSIIPPVAAFGRVQAAILTKRMDFKSLTLRDLVATIVGGGLGVIAAFSEYGVYSLVIQQIAMVFTATIMLWYATGWRPKFEFSMFEIKKLFGFSSYVFLDSLMRQVFLKIDTLFVGKVFSATTLGFYTRAESLKAQIQTYSTKSLSKVIFPVLSRLQDDNDKFNLTYFRAFNIITGLVTLLIAPIYFLSEFIIIFLFGEKWESSIILFQILILSICTGPQGALMSNAILAKGYSKLRFNVGLFQRVLKLIPIALGLFYGIVIFTWGMVISSLLVVVMFFIVFQIKFKINVWFQIKNLVIPNSIFLAFLLIHFIYADNINPWLFSILFLFTHILFIILINHESYIFIKNNILKISSKRKK
jgi:O-antigen/teichoic acid export membrane protein